MALVGAAGGPEVASGPAFRFFWEGPGATDGKDAEVITDLAEGGTSAGSILCKLIAMRIFDWSEDERDERPTIWSALILLIQSMAMQPLEDA